MEIAPATNKVVGMLIMQTVWATDKVVDMYNDKD